MPRISFPLELIQLIDGIKEPNENITQFIHRSINKMLKDNYNIYRKNDSNGKRNDRKRY